MTGRLSCRQGILCCSVVWLRQASDSGRETRFGSQTVRQRETRGDARGRKEKQETRKRESTSLSVLDRHPRVIIDNTLPECVCVCDSTTCARFLFLSPLKRKRLTDSRLTHARLRSQTCCAHPWPSRHRIARRSRKASLLGSGS